MSQLLRRSTTAFLCAGALAIASPSFAATPPALAEWRPSGTATGPFSIPLGLAVSMDPVVVADFENGRIQKSTLDGDFLLAGGDVGGTQDQRLGPSSVGGVLIPDLCSLRTQTFTDIAGWIRSDLYALTFNPANPHFYMLSRGDMALRERTESGAPVEL